MKKTLLILITISSSLFSQKLTYSFGDGFKDIKKHRDKGFYKFNDDEYAEVYIQKDEKDMVFQIFDRDFKTVKRTATATFPEFEKPPTDEGFFSVKKDLFWFYSTWDRSTETERLFALPFNNEKLEFASKGIKLIESGKLDRSYGKYHYNYSADSSKMLVTYRVKPIEKRDRLNKDIIGFNLYDHKMNTLYAREIEMPYTEAEMDNLDYEIDSYGNVYMLAQVKINNSKDGEVNKDRENRNAVRYELIRVNKKNNTLQCIKINLDNKYTSSVILSEGLNHDVIISGYYYDQKNSNGVNGAYIIRLENDENNTVKNLRTTYCEFPLETLKAYESKRSKRKMDKKDKDGELGASNLRLRKLAFYPDGSVMIIGEEYYVISHTTSNGKTTTTTYTYHYNDILVLKADKAGKTLWCNKIPKQQYGSGTGDLSYYHHTYKGDDYFFYIDNIKNINLSLDEEPASHTSGRGGYLTYVKIDAAGKMSKSSLFDTKKVGVRIFPKDFESVTGNLIVERVYAGKKESKVFKIEFE